MTLEELLRDRAEKGEMTHFSIYYSASRKVWSATYTPSHEFNSAIAEHRDPITAAVKALETPKTKRVRSKADDPRRQSKSEPAPETEGDGGSGEDRNPDAGTDWFRKAGA